MRFCGEAWWLTTALLYLPRIGFALPLPFVVLALTAFGPRRWLVGLPVPIAILLGPLMGLATSSWVGTAEAARRPLRVLSYNIAAAERPEAVAATIAGVNADLILLQEWDHRQAESLAAAVSGYHQNFAGQFGVLSRFPIVDIFAPARIELPATAARSARYMRYRIETPDGVVTVFNIHPVSPRNGLEEFRGEGMLEQLRKGRIGRHEGIAVLRKNAELRWRQAEAIAAAASAETGPVIIAGDTNLPGLSRAYAATFARWTDGFSEAGAGFGYTFPSHRPWMRIDRILTSSDLRFARFDVVPSRASDHLAVIAEIVRR